MERWTGSRMLYAFVEFAAYCPDREVWSVEALAENPPRRIRLQRLIALARAFDVRPDFRALDDADFVYGMDGARLAPLGGTSRLALQRLAQYLVRACELRRFNAGVLEASGEHLLALQLTEEASAGVSRAVAPIERVVDEVFGASFTEAELAAYGWPPDDLWEADLDAF